jgi:sigma-B regulation protein RsbU (phosphoserine phosphatase)
LTKPTAISPDALSQLRHDLRTPVNQILGYSEMLQEDAEAAGHSTYVPDLQKIQFAARQLEAVIDEKLGGHVLLAPSSFVTATGEPHLDDTPLHGSVLVVDDNPGNRDVLSRRLERHGLRVETAANGVEALEILRSLTFDLVLLDLHMPVMDGHATLLEIKRDPGLRHIPVIMVSALAEIEEVIRCIDAGAEDYLPKPFNPVLLRARLAVCLEKKALADASRNHLQNLEETRKRLSKELAEAARYVCSILPAPLQEPFRVDWEHHPSSEIGGDAFGYHWIDPDHFAIYLLDVCGHGVAASLLSVSAINIIRSGALPGTDFRDPSAVLSALNGAFPMERQNQMYFTMWYGVFHVPSRSLCHASGGHPPALLLDGDKTQRLHSPGMIVGALPDSIFPSQTVKVPAGASLIVACDGCFEIRDTSGGLGDFDAFEKFMRCHGRSDSALADLLASVQKRLGTETLEDDFSIVRVRF